MDLVWTGPETLGVTNRDTGVVVRELFGAAETEVLVAGFAVYQGRDVFKRLAERMEERPGLRVKLFLDVQRHPTDTSLDRGVAAPVRPPLPHAGMARRAAAGAVLRSAVAGPGRRQAFQPAREVHRRGSPGGLRDVGELHRGGPDAEHRGRRPDPLRTIRRPAGRAFRDAGRCGIAQVT